MLKFWKKFHRTEYFTPSRTLTAEDVRFSFERMLDPARTCAGATCW